jgi:tagatose 1,6-diphosphate aldolase GatY/KbaY
MLTATTEILESARRGGYAVGAFNVYNMEGAKAVIAAAEAERSPALLQLHPSAMTFGGAPLLALCLEAARASTIPAAVHLDHSASADAIRSALNAGITSVMADGSRLPYADNLAFTREMAAYAHAAGAAVEAELGLIAGTEDGLTVADIEARMTDPALAASFAAETGIDALAVCIGNVHGHYRAAPRLDFDRLKRIRDQVDAHLVLHGASGLPDAMIRQAVVLGVTKFNVNTEVRDAYLSAIRATLHGNPAADLLDVMGSAVAAMRLVVAAKLHLFGSFQQA